MTDKWDLDELTEDTEAVAQKALDLLRERIPALRMVIAEYGEQLHLEDPLKIMSAAFEDLRKSLLRVGIVSLLFRVDAYKGAPQARLVLDEPLTMDNFQKLDRLALRVTETFAKSTTHPLEDLEVLAAITEDILARALALFKQIDLSDPAPSVSGTVATD